MVNSVAIRLGTDGKAQVKADFAEVADSGDASAKRLVASYERASDEIATATKRQADAAAKISAIMPSSTQATVNAAVGTGYSPGQNANAAQYAALLAQEERQVEAVRAALDPLYNAQKRYDAEIATADALLKRKAITDAEHAGAVALSGKALQDAKNALEGHTGAIGLNRQQTIIAQSAVLRFTDAVIAGRNPLTALALEAHKGVEVLSSDEGGMAGGLAKVRTLLTGTTVEVGAVAAVVAIGAAAWITYADALAKLDTVASGAGAVIGATGDQLEANAEAASRSSTLTVGAARDVETAYVRMGGIGNDVLEGLTAITADFAAATGQDLAAAEQQLGRAMQDPVKGAEDLAARYGTLSQAQVEQIKQLADQGNLYGAQKQLLDDLGPAFDGAAKHAEGFALAFNEIKKAAGEAFTAVGSFLNKQGPGIVFTLTGIPLPGTFDGKGPPPARGVPNAQGNAFAEQALKASDDFSGRRQLETLQTKQADLKRALDNPGAVASLQQAGQLDKTRQALEAYTHAIDTYLPPAEKKRQIDLADVAIAQARASRNPAALAAAAAHREQIEQSGQVATKADVEADALAKGERARARLDGAAGKHAETLAREAAAMDATTKGALAAATAYLTVGAAAGEEADAQGKATAAATKSGADVSAQVRRQLAQSVAEGNEAGAKAVSSLRLETAARTQVNLATEQGTIGVDRMAHALSDENALRELTIKQSLAQRLGMTADYDAITATIKAYRQALDEAHASEADTGSIKALDDIRKRVEDAQLAKRFAGDNTGAYERSRAILDANRAADANGDDADQRAARINATGKASDDDTDTKRSRSMADQRNAQADAIELAKAEIGLAGASEEKRAEIVAELQKEIELRRTGVDLGSDEARATIAGAGAQVKVQAELAKTNDSMNALRQVGDKFIDDLFNPKDNGLKSLLKDAKQELKEMALINPLKNLLGGSQLPTLGGLFGGGSAGAAGAAGGIGKLIGAIGGFFGNKIIPGFASGTDYSPAGPAWVGEQGPELLNLPQGTKVTNAADTRRMMSAANDPAHIRVSIESNDDMFNARVSSISGAHVQAAAPGIRSGAVSDVKDHYARQGHYSYGQR